MATPRPWVNRRKTLRARALKQYPGRTFQWINGELHFTKQVQGKETSAGLVPGFAKVPKGPHIPSEYKLKRHARRAAERSQDKVAAQ